MQPKPVELINVGIGANVISTRSRSYEQSGKPAANERLDKHVIAHNPDLLTISYGLNDARGGTPIDLFAEELETVVDRIRGECQPLIVLLGPYFMAEANLQGGAPEWADASLELLHAYNERIVEIADAKHCLFVDLLAAYGRTEWMVHGDGIHANDLGHLVVANRVFEVLAQNCSGLAKNTKVMEQHIPPWRDESMLASDYGYTRGPLFPSKG